MSKGKDYFSKSLEKGLKILSLFNKKSPVLTQSEIARMISLNITSTYRYINTLVELNYLEKDAKTKEIRPSSHCLIFGTNLLQTTDYLKVIKEVVDRIHREHNISIEVAFAVDDSLMRVYNREANETFTYCLSDHTNDCLHNTALGKAYLSSLPEDQLVERIKGLKLLVRTEKTITDRDVLLTHIRAVKAQEFAMTEEEYLPGLLSIAAPLYGSISAKGIGAVSFDFSVMQHSPEEIRQKCGNLIKQTARTLSELLTQH